MIRILSSQTEELFGAFGQVRICNAGLALADGFATIVSTISHSFSKDQFQRVRDALSCTF